MHLFRTSPVFSLCSSSSRNSSIAAVGDKAPIRRKSTQVQIESTEVALPSKETHAGGEASSKMERQVPAKEVLDDSKHSPQSQPITQQVIDGAQVKTALKTGQTKFVWVDRALNREINNQIKYAATINELNYIVQTSGHSFDMVNVASCTVRAAKVFPKDLKDYHVSTKRERAEQLSNTPSNSQLSYLLSLLKPLSMKYIERFGAREASNIVSENYQCLFSPR